VLEEGFEFLEGLGEPVVEVGGGEDAGIEVAFAHETDVTGTTIVFCERDGLEVLRAIVGGDSVEMVNAVRVIRDRSHKSHIDGMMDEDVTIIQGHLVIDLLSATVLFVLRSRGVLGSELMVSAMMEGVEFSFG